MDYGCVLCGRASGRGEWYVRFMQARLGLVEMSGVRKVKHPSTSGVILDNFKLAWCVKLSMYIIFFCNLFSGNSN